MFNRRVTLVTEGGAKRSDCSAHVARATFENAFELICARELPGDVEIQPDDSGCVIRAPRWAWTVYYCALSLGG